MDYRADRREALDGGEREGEERSLGAHADFRSWDKEPPLPVDPPDADVDGLL